MSNSDFYIQNMIEASLEQEDFSQIIILLDSLPSKNIRRALYLLSKIFPNKIEILRMNLNLLNVYYPIINL